MNVRFVTARGYIPIENMTEERWDEIISFNPPEHAELAARAHRCGSGLWFIGKSDRYNWQDAPYEVWDFEGSDGMNRVICLKKAEPDPSSMQFTGYIEHFCSQEDFEEAMHKAIKAAPLPLASEDRKKVPLASIFDFFPLAMVELAKCIYVGNEKHNQGNPIQWQREKSDDHSDCLLRHFMERGYTDTDGIQHSAKVAWRALAILQLELERCADKKP